MAKLIATATNGKAVPFSYVPSTYYVLARQRGYRLRVTLRNGVILAWTEKAPRS